VNKIYKITQYSKDVVEDAAQRFIEDWRWDEHGVRRLLKHRCIHAKHERELSPTAVGEWTTAHGGHVRSICYFCRKCGDTWEIRQVSRSGEHDWCVPMMLINQQFAYTLP